MSTYVVAGGGAAGFFAAIACAEQFPGSRIVLLEKTRQLLTKVRISGGGRCNVTHACFDPALLVKNYPRGTQELRGPFSRFQPQDTIRWFESRGVVLKTEEDGRMFPTSDLSETIIDCLLKEAKRLGVEICLEWGIQEIESNPAGGILIRDGSGNEIKCSSLLLATGSAPKVYPLLEKLGHRIIPLVPSLFTFNIPDSPFLDLSGIAHSPVSVKLPHLQLEQTGPLLFTHWGLSGPAVLKLSSWAARELHAVDYQTQVSINWLPALSSEEIAQCFNHTKQNWGARLIGTESPPLFSIPKQLWKRLITLAGIRDELRWSSLSQNLLRGLMLQLQSTRLDIKGKTTYKQEFVSCGGVALEDVNFKTMESKRCKSLFFAGEILNIDGVTGGFNFQNAWTTGWIAGRSMGLRASL